MANPPTPRVNKTPPINASGIYKLYTPFDVLYTASPGENVFKCEAITGFNALQKKFENVKNVYYEPYGIAGSYDDDLEADINIITLIRPNGDAIYVPSSYIESYPGEPGVNYGRIIISVDLGPLPADFPVGDLADDMVEMAESMVGNANMTSSIHVVPMRGFVTASQEKTASSNRLDATLNAITPTLQRLTSQNNLVAANTKITALEELLGA